ncbi:hypothetical protein ACH5RR_006743 [Cinchona calisaya]|uniref:Uncharacterized protein n=1 Tax=Cinchona calisaya TaxID=153742 RepID=A0ABD3APV5_9GENT
MKLHLAEERGSIAPCTKVAPEVRHAILGSLKEYAQKTKERRGDFGEENPYGRSMNDFAGNDIQEIPPPRAKGVSINMVGASAGKGKRKVTIGINTYFKGGCDTSQPTIKACLQSKEKQHDTDMAITLWSYDTCIPISVVNSPFYQRAIDQIASMRSYDPVDYESNDKTEFWVVEEEPIGKLDYEVLEVELEELPVDDDVECSNSQQVEDWGIGVIDEDDEWKN